MSAANPSSAWDRHSDCYARVTSPFTGYIAQALFHHVAGRLPAAPRILDVACGNGELSRAAALHCLSLHGPGNRGSVLATDASSGMVALASRNLESLDASDIVRCEVQDGQALSLETASFDAVFSAFGIFLFPDRHAGWREAARVLKPGGLLATAVWRGPQHNALVRLQSGPVMAALPDRVRDGLTPPGWFEITSREGLAHELQGFGLCDVEVSVFDAVLTAPTPRVMWEMMCDNPLSQAVFAACTEAEFAAVKASCLASFLSMSGGVDRAVRFEASCHFAVARRT
ncbi:MAG: class I SAM-dependent methyltransferase [Sandaracinaceae bacterium]